MDKNVSGNNKDTKEAFKNTPNVGGMKDTSAKDSSLNSSSAMGTSMNAGSLDQGTASSGLNASSIGSTVTGAMGTARTAISEKAGPAMDYLKDNFSTAQDSAQVYIDEAEALIKRYPFYTVLGAAAVGAVVGMFMSRPSSRSNMNV